jgi:hypothetical protein
VDAVQRDLLAPLRADARISEAILAEARIIFLSLPARIQARILLTAILNTHAMHAKPIGDEHSTVGSKASVAADSGGRAAIVCDLLSAGGVVAVKLAQMLAEDPKVPADYRALLGQLRSSNEPMGIGETWSMVPPTARDRIAAFGKRLGVGSIKQVHRVKVYAQRSAPSSPELREPTGSQRAADAETLETIVAALGVLRANVEEEALASSTLPTGPQLPAKSCVGARCMQAWRSASCCELL